MDTYARRLDYAGRDHITFAGGTVETAPAAAEATVGTMAEWLAGVEPGTGSDLAPDEVRCCFS